MGLLAAGDLRTPVDILRFLVANQKGDGTWFQNFWINGDFYWGGLQMDEVAFPVLLAHQIQKRGFYRLNRVEMEMVRRAATFIRDHGPVTEQDRWEEIGGYVPSTIAAEIAALRAASQLIGDPSFEQTANIWQAQIEAWTLVPEGPHGRNYYLRVSPNGTPARPTPIDIANNGGRALSTEIVDGGFLELVRLGIRDAHDPYIRSTLQVYESPALGIAQSYSGLRNAMTYRRYNRDGYGAGNVGGFWPLLAGERGHYSIAAGDFNRARSQLMMLEMAALPSGNIPEQTISARPRNSVGLGVACPLVWAHAEDILLHRSIEEGAIFDAP